MPITYDIKNDALYKQGVEQGVEQGVKQGVKQGMKQGVQLGVEKGIESVAIRCLEQGKGHEEIAIITGLSISQIKNIDEKRKGK